MAVALPGRPGGSQGRSDLIGDGYGHDALFQRYPIVDELLGGFLGLVQGAIIIGAVILILDPFYGLAYELFRDEAAILRSLHQAYDTSLTADIFRDQLLPGFIALFGALIPDAVEAAFPAAS